jgi:hypothetical protein
MKCAFKVLLYQVVSFANLYVLKLFIVILTNTTICL